MTYKPYNPAVIEPKWQKVWEKNKLDVTDIKGAKRPFYNLMMFPYPSAEGLHVGNTYAFIAADIYGRFKRLTGFDVFEPIGLDGFGIHSENYCLNIGKHPMEHAAVTEKRFYRDQLARIGNMFDWSRTVETYKPDYYRWTQWLFVKMFKAGLAYRAKASVNWCPSCKTVLSDEQVIDGKCERCSAEVIKKELEQWFFRITKYADRLLEGHKKIDWSEKVITAQRNWIGRSEGVNLKHKVKDMNIEFEVYDSIPQTFMAQTFVVIAPEHSLVEKLVKGTEYEKPVMEFVGRIKAKKAKKNFDIAKETEGIFTGRYSENYMNTGKDLPIWVASFALVNYGTGIVGSSAHDERDFAFAKKYNIPLKPVLFPTDKKQAEKVRNLEVFYREPNGILEEPAIFRGMRWDKAREPIIDYIEEAKFGARVVNYHLRDWLISRQRYWGPPIPMIDCPKCGWVPVPEADLPVELPFVEDYQPKGTGRGPLAGHPEFYKTTCPKCGGPAQRETDVTDNFLDSAWYELRYPSVGVAGTVKNGEELPWDERLLAKWLPVDMYTGGPEHSVLHLMYFRFIAMALFDAGYLPFAEPCKSFFAHGMLIKDGAKMSKSKGNVVNPDEYIDKFGADTLRLYLMFMGPVENGGDWRDTGIAGMRRWVERVWTLLGEQIAGPANKPDSKVSTEIARLIKKAERDFEARHYNTTIAGMMGFLNLLSREGLKMTKGDIESFLIVLAPLAPCLVEELWSTLGHKDSIHQQKWPIAGSETGEGAMVVIAVSVNGKTRATLDFSAQQAKALDQKQIEVTAKSNDRVAKYLVGKEIKRVVYVPGKIVNFVV